jgi:hypothetical protein
MEALRQMIYRKKFEVKKIGNRVYLDNDEVMRHFARKSKLPAFEDVCLAYSNDRYISIEQIQGQLNYSHVHLKNLIKSGKLVGYCTADGQIVISKESLDKFMGVNSDAQDL